MARRVDEDQTNRLLGHILTPREPFGPRATETVVDGGALDPEAVDSGEAALAKLFDRSNLIYAQVSAGSRPTYIIGRKGAGKTTFLRGAASDRGHKQVMLRTATVYAEMVAVLNHYRQVRRSPLFVPQAAEIWLALFDHVALFHACDTAVSDDPPDELQVMWDYLAAPPYCRSDATSVVERFLAELQRRIEDPSVRGVRELVDGMERGGIAFGRVRPALRALMARRPERLTIVMDNLEDLHARIFELEEVLAGLFHAVGLAVTHHGSGRPFGLQLCLPSELWDQIHRVSANPEKDFAGNYLTIYWTARSCCTSPAPATGCSCRPTTRVSSRRSPRARRAPTSPMWGSCAPRYPISLVTAEPRRIRSPTSSATPSSCPGT
ncbi:hypothetical protein FHX44_117102 [Pseudonocardia hierapolitana]|uniref:Uncharacterized protein n=1 Tax=Pseudonocardia hierapolitana TaxID=1128676 RepID=A0A561T221_9PSEU|nr:hypothetical protein [Pseudonocardia hierapolitana]TWF81159.1 hypothetical protein FHX44_117102 [Pseudonocardia hierapolitana]